MGSKKSLLEAMFMDKKRAFYKSVKYFVVAEIALSSWVEFIASRFVATGKRIDNHCINAICAIIKGFPYYTAICL